MKGDVELDASRKLWGRVASKKGNALSTLWVSHERTFDDRDFIKPFGLDPGVVVISHDATSELIWQVPILHEPFHGIHFHLERAGGVVHGCHISCHQTENVSKHQTPDEHYDDRCELLDFILRNNVPISHSCHGRHCPIDGFDIHTPNRCGVARKSVAGYPIARFIVHLTGTPDQPRECEPRTGHEMNLIQDDDKTPSLNTYGTQLGGTGEHRQLMHERTMPTKLEFNLTFPVK